MEETIKETLQIVEQKRDENQRLKSYFSKTNTEIKSIHWNGEYDEKLYKVK